LHRLYIAHTYSNGERILLSVLLKSGVGAVHRALFDFLFARRSKDWQPASPRPLPAKPRIILSGFIHEALGIGRAGRLTQAAVEAAGFETIGQDLRPLHRGLLTRSPRPLPGGDGAGIWIIHANPPEARIALFQQTYESWRKLYRIGYWAWETSRAPASWAPVAKWFHEIWVPSDHVREALRMAFVEAGCEDQVEKLRVMPHPVPIPPLPLDKGSRRINVLCMFDPGSDFARKNPMGTIDAWLRLFPQATETAHLTVKTLGSAKGLPQYGEMQRKTAGRSDIVVLAETLDEAQTRNLIAASDVVVSLHRGEGFGLVLAEAMAHGRCVIATGWSGNMQFMSPENSIPVPFSLSPANKRYNGPVAQWAEPAGDFAVAALDRLIRDREMRERLGTWARRDLAMLADAWSRAELFGQADD